LAKTIDALTFEGQALTGVDWVPGQKVQIAMGEGFVTRTYTPVEWEAKAGRAAIVGYAHGGGPGSAWLRDIKPGNECDILGPRASIDTRAISGPLVLFGDETSIGLAGAIARQGL
jgi:NADPH-dependent ferric siderophore reductase